MLHWRTNRPVRKPAGVLNKYKYFYITLLGLWLSGTASCGFADLSPIGMSAVPGKSDTVLPEAYSPVILSFDTEMDKFETEGILQVNSGAGALEGDRFWKGNDLYFVPVPGWTAGTRYTLNVSGKIRSIDGRELRLEQYVPFYAINKSPPPLLESFSPEDGMSVGTGGLLLSFRFSLPMERHSTEQAITVEGMGDKKFEWSDDDRQLTVIPEKNPAPWMTYRWTLKNSAKSRDGVPLAKTVSALFSTDLDQRMPRVSKVFPVIPSNGRWLFTGDGIENGLGPGQGIAVEFNKPMGENVLRSLRFDPSFAGRTETLSANSVVFIPSRDPEPETAYTLIVSADTKDAEGLKMGDDYRLHFIPDIPFMRVLSFSADGIDPLDLNSAGGDMGGGSVPAVPVDPATGGLLRFTVRFSLPFDDDAKKNAALKISLVPFFPGTLSPIALRVANWISDDRLRMEWEELKGGNEREAHYYRLVIPGGKGGITNGGGMYLKEDQYLFLEAVNE